MNLTIQKIDNQEGAYVMQVQVQVQGYGLNGPSARTVIVKEDNFFAEVVKAIELQESEAELMRQRISQEACSGLGAIGGYN